ncbi:putative gustatory receptor 28b [Bradysia coprophila]|uniref:putative gustatory receptor 28b n=1 Tax=Bradysia coprophila TaxID=38358 RepID=UPI00187D8CB9|nr:putative gustatory receptor 28b [Bradysia coprophila]
MFSLNVPAKYSNTVYDTIRPLYIPSRFFGLLPFSATIARPSSNEIYLTKVDYFLFIIHELAYISCTVFNFYADIHDVVSSSKLLETGVKYQVILGCILSCILVVVELVFRSATWDIIESINDFDLKFLTLDKTIDHSNRKQRLKRFLVLWLLIFLICSIGSFILSLEHVNGTSILLFLTSYSLVNITYGCAATFYTFLLFSLKVRYESLNNCLRDEGQLIQPIKMFKHINKGTSCDKIMKMTRLHDQLTDIIGLVNRRFAFQVLILVAADFVFSVFSIFSFYRASSTEPFDLKEFRSSIIHNVWGFYYDFFILVIIWMGSSVKSEGAYTGVLIHKTINNYADKDTVEKLILFSQQLKHQSPIATCKLFPIDWTLFFTMVGATTTYLTILIQFDSSFQGNILANATIANGTKS